MIELGLVDLSADSRRKLSALVERWAWSGPDKRVSLPRLSITLLAPEELRFHGSLDVCVVGPEILACDAACIATIRPHIPGKILLCVLDSETYSFGMVEQLGRLGVDDVLLDSASSDEFFRRLLLLQRRVGDRKRGRLHFVTSARGGVGATLVATAVAEGLVRSEKRVCLVDCDAFSQDATRFLQVRPFLNEPLKLLIDQQRVLTSETLAECIRPVWSEGAGTLSCVPPPVAPDASIFVSPQAGRALAAVLDALRLQFDEVVVDASALLRVTQQALVGVADNVVFVMNRDSSGAYANRQALALLGGALALDSKLSVVINHTGGAAAPLEMLKREVVCVPGREIVTISLPFSPKAARWACSGRTAYHDLRRQLRPVVESADPSSIGVVQRASEWLRARFDRKRRHEQLQPDGVGQEGNERLRYRTDRRSSERALTAVAPIRGFLEGSFQDETLVSKPVLLGR
jgi:MinD-like ATPase involved in chromosome partitioning or flagellar assembly